ncbi:MAG TPA: FHA domain-containing protein [Steroidobacteraceae bacterium]|nr:FHA domain-containing protein [Steroidobacteraceae bacterium]
MFGLEYSDAAFALAQQGELRVTHVPTGSPAAELASWLTTAVPEEASRQLWVAVGPELDAAAMGEVLRALRSTEFQVQGFVDRSAVLAGWQQLPGHHISIAQSRQQTLISVAFHDGTAVELQRTVKLPGGAQRLHDAWLQLAAQTLVQQTRFDPLHDLRHEAALRAALPALVAAAARDGQAQYSMDAAGRELTLALTRDQLEAACAPALRSLAASLQTLAAGMPEATLLVSESLAQMPGMDAVLDSAHLPRILVASPGSAACAASALDASAPLTSGAVQYLTRVPLPHTQPPPPPLSAWQGRDAQPAMMATHVVYRGRAVAIDADGLVLGREVDDAHSLRLPEGVAGLSRRHCTLRRERGRTQIVDHSRYGSFLDGARVNGRAFLAAGSVLRLGTPGIELALVALADSSATER